MEEAKTYLVGHLSDLFSDLQRYWGGVEAARAARNGRACRGGKSSAKHRHVGKSGCEMISLGERWSR